MPELLLHNGERVPIDRLRVDCPRCETGQPLRATRPRRCAGCGTPVLPDWLYLAADED